MVASEEKDRKFEVSYLCFCFFFFLVSGYYKSVILQKRLDKDPQ